MDQDYEADVCCRPNVQAAYLHLIGRYEERFLFLHYFHLFANDLAAKNLLLVLTDHEHVVAHVTEFFRLFVYGFLARHFILLLLLIVGSLLSLA